MQFYALNAGFPYPAIIAQVGANESNGDTNIVNSIGATGWLQILQPTHVKSHPSWTSSWLKKPLNNAVAAKVLWDADIKAGGDGLGPWEASRNKGAHGGWGKTQAYTDFKNKTVSHSAGPIGQAVDGISGAANSVADAASAAADAVTAPVDGLKTIAQAITNGAKWGSNPSNWVRIAYVLGGVGIVGFIAVNMAKGSPTVQAATAAATKGLA